MARTGHSRYAASNIATDLEHTAHQLIIAMHIVVSSLLPAIKQLGHAQLGMCVFHCKDWPY